MNPSEENEQAILHTPEDIRIFREITDMPVRGGGCDFSSGAGIAAAGLAFLGRPYGAHTLEGEGPERLVINLRELDCFTLVENVVVLERLFRTGATGFPDYAATLRRLRYRNGILDGFASRLHYFSDWLSDAGAKGFLRDVTADLGGQWLVKSISYMTDHPERYPALEDEETFRRLREIEGRLSARPLVFLPREKLRRVEDRFQDGDILAITTDRGGMDVVHAGIALRLRRRVHFLHASSLAGKVLISPETLYGYLMKKKGRTGVIVARVV